MEIDSLSVMGSNKKSQEQINDPFDTKQDFSKEE
jgi:hypothetical protein